jgi:hypothetical protein
MIHWHYLSFCGTDGWLGACHVRAKDFDDAFKTASRLHLVPDTCVDVKICRVPDGLTPPAKSQGRLITEVAELRELLGPLHFLMG